MLFNHWHNIFVELANTGSNVKSKIWSTTDTQELFWSWLRGEDNSHQNRHLSRYDVSLWYSTLREAYMLLKIFCYKVGTKKNRITIAILNIVCIVSLSQISSTPIIIRFVIAGYWATQTRWLYCIECFSRFKIACRPSLHTTIKPEHEGIINYSVLIGHVNVQSCLFTAFQYQPICLRYSWQSV